MPNKLSDKMITSYAKQLAGVMGDLEASVIAFMGQAGKVGPEAAAMVLNSRPAFLAMLQESGYNDLANSYVAKYGEVPKTVSKAFAARGLPAPQYSTVSKETFQGLARMDLAGFKAIGTKAVDDLRLGIYRQTISGAKFQDIVKTIRASTVGTSVKGSPLRNYSYTHANTAVLNFNGEVIREAGESIGFDSDDDLWEITGPVDDATRDICNDAMSDPVRTRGEWIGMGYWGGSPGGYNCRHEFFPYAEELKEVA